MICQECGGQFKIISSSHLKKCANITVQEYKEKYNLKYVSDESVRESSTGSNNPNYKDGNTYTKVPCIECGTLITGRGKSGMCKSCARKGKNNHFYGKTHTEVVKNKLIESHKTRDKATYKYGLAHKGVISKAQKKYWASVSKEDKAIKLKKFIEAGQVSCKKNKNTKIEKYTYNVLKRYEDLLQNVKIPTTSYYADFLIPSLKLIVECYGDYWHCNPEIYSDTFYNKSLKMTAQEKWAKDGARLEVFNKLGYKTIVVWENQDIEEKLKELLLKMERVSDD